MNDCPFCRIASGQTDAVIVWEDADLVVFLDIVPVREGHCQVMPRAHIETFEQMPPELAAKVLWTGQRLARRLKALYGVERVAFAFTGGDVAHVHAHVIPMHEKTDVTSARFIVSPETVEFRSAHLRADRETLLAVRERLKFE